MLSSAVRGFFPLRATGRLPDAVEPLEGRRLLSVVPTGVPDLVNPPDAVGGFSRLDVAGDAAGNYAVAWRTDGHDGPEGRSDVFVRLYDAAGAPRGEPILVTSAAGGPHGLAMDADGEFAVAWHAVNAGVLVQRFSAAGVAQSLPADYSGFNASTIAMGPGGDFVLLGGRVEGNGQSLAIVARAFGPDGVARGPEVRVNDRGPWPLLGQPRQMRAGMDAGGNFVVAWQTWNLEGRGQRLLAQRFGPTGAPQGGSFAVSAPDDPLGGLEMDPALDVNAAGEFVVGWTGLSGVRARAFGADGSPRGGTVHLDDVVMAFGAPWPVGGPAVAIADDGRFAAAWPDDKRLRARAFDPSGRPLGDQTVVDVGTAVSWDVGLTADADGDLVAGYQGYTPGRPHDLFVQRLRIAPPAAGIEGVWVGGSDWSVEFGDRMRDLGWGESGRGYAAYNAAGAQTLPLPWAGLDRVSIRFGRDVDVAREDLRVRGVNVPSYAIADFHYDPAARTATWTLGRTVPADRVTVELDGRVLAAPGQDGPDFSFPINVLPGDARRDGVVNALDVTAVKGRLATSTATGAGSMRRYSPFTDVTGDGRIDALDLAAVKRELTRRLPTAPAAPAAPSATRELLGTGA